MKLYLLGLIVLLAIILRSYHWAELSVFKSDQVIELSGARDILHGKFTLIGIKTSVSEVRNGAVMYYLLAPLIWLFRGDPVAGAVLQTGLQLGAIVLIFFTLKSNPRAGLIASFILAVWPLLITYSRQTQLAFYPLFFYSLLFYLFTKKPAPLIIGGIVGFMLQIHYSSVTALIFCLIYLHQNGAPYWRFFLGLFLGFSPMILFELRHEFFNFHQLVISLQNQMSVPVGQNYHYAIGLFVPAAMLVALVLKKINWKLTTVILLSGLLCIKPDFTAKDWTVAQTKEAVTVISQNLIAPYNVAMITGGESQGLPLRYFLDRLDHKPLPVTEYGSADYLYVVTEPGINLQEIFFPELNLFGAYNTTRAWTLTKNYKLYELKKSV